MLSGAVSPTMLLSLSGLWLVAVAASGLLALRAHERSRRRDARMAAVVRPYRPEPVVELSAFKPLRRVRRPLIQRAVGLLGVDVARADLYPLPWWIVPIGAFVAVGLLAFMMKDLAGVYATPIMVVVGIGLCRAGFGWMRDRRRERQLRQFPDVLSTIVRSVSVGIPMLEAMRGVAREVPEPTGPEFSRMLEQISIGVPLEDGLHDMAARSGLPEYRFFATALALQTQTGGSPRATLEGLADVIRKRLALKARGYALASEARASAAVLALLPLALGALLWLTNRTYIRLLFTDPAGHVILALAIGSLAMGILMMRAIIRRTLT
ncbi:type II secretion system protein F [Gluconacetobacter sp. 1b LMG 1731]|uniref:Type II secretion system protein F n=1 Tax=Gluconacetobacter dulcium TaxID=2729096 RepID=A0A7W4IIW2_9PROT|nr:type II secretion system F family protein [Gluconacetobacter dulcium]MBB2163688.1 type II secretion system protein F [Gluconacetobacter dulcium]MBB2192898.1 type II secretion system protein F [Gluconacetobacter dulcium]